RAVQRSGALSVLVRLLARSGKNAVAQVGSLTALSAMLSMVINNVAALSLMMHVSIQLARCARRSPSIVLMPLAFASLLGGMVTLIG
ncbi:MAG: SLC13 family permease, partial [Chloroflexota bacterium]|nr:SLC13 family permease [Chloroflexota bacterium]